MIVLFNYYQETYLHTTQVHTAIYLESFILGISRKTYKKRNEDVKKRGPSGSVSNSLTIHETNFDFF